MIEDAKVLDDGRVFEPTKRLRGLAAVGDVADTVAEVSAMSEHGEDVSGRGKLHIPVGPDGAYMQCKRLQCRRIIGLFANTEHEGNCYVMVQITSTGTTFANQPQCCNGATLDAMKWCVA